MPTYAVYSLETGKYLFNATGEGQSYQEALSELTGAKIVNDTTCVGCKVSTISCPFGTINYVQD